MVSFKYLLLASAAVSGAVAGVVADVNRLDPRAGTPSSTGTSGGFYYSFYTDNGGNVTYTNKAGGEYNVVWSNSGNFVAGKGWNPGSAR